MLFNNIRRNILMKNLDVAVRYAILLFILIHMGIEMSHNFEGKYSPTVSPFYFKDSNWWQNNGGGTQDDGYHKFDKDGFDQYGYNAQGLDRAGKSLTDYASKATNIQPDWGQDIPIF